MPQLGYDVSKDVTRPTVSSANQSNPYSFYTPTGQGIPTSYIADYNANTALNLEQVSRQYTSQTRATGAGNAAARNAANDRLKFGLRGIGLDRQELGLNRRDAVENAINNALQRGIYNSGIRARNVNRANERADLQGKRIQLNEDELRASIKNALASLNAQAKANAVASQIARDQALEQYEMNRRFQLGQYVSESGGAYSDASVLRGSIEDQYATNYQRGGYQ